MSISRRSPVPEKAELETVTDWHMIAAGVGLLVAFITVPFALSFLLPTHPAPARVAAQPQPATPAPAEPAVATPVAALRPQFSFPPLEPFPVRKASPPPAGGGTTAIAAVASATPDTSRETFAANAAAPPAQPAFRRRGDLHYTSDRELLRALLRTDAILVSLDAVEGASRKLSERTDDNHPLLTLLQNRPDLHGLPARAASECELSSKAARGLALRSQASRRWRAALTRIQIRGNQPDPTRLLDLVAKELETDWWAQPEAVSTLEQVLQTEEMPVGLLLVKQFASIHGPEAGAALARRAVFDVSEEVRQAAVKALKDRPPEHIRPTFLAALRYPWAPAADYAAEALVNLNDKAAVGDLVKLVDLPDPAAPAYDAEKMSWAVAELVCVNHLRNCQLCHASSSSRRDPVRGLIPTPGEPLKFQYYDSMDGNFIRADVTYLRQDFSVMQPVEKAEPWPEYQRFDYLVRRRELPEKEGAALAAAARGRDYPQRGAVLFALRELTGTSDWPRGSTAR